MNPLTGLGFKAFAVLGLALDPFALHETLNPKHPRLEGALVLPEACEACQMQVRADSASFKASGLCEGLRVEGLGLTV